ncbi:unnamed protein product, partial [marine sediment metagenome]
LEAGQAREAVQFFTAVRSIGDLAFMEICLSIVETSKQSVIVLHGRELVEWLVEHEGD